MSRYLGMLARTLGKFDREEEHFEHALEVKGRMRADLRLAHTKVGSALLLRFWRQQNAENAPTRAERTPPRFQHICEMTSCGLHRIGR
jgi:hypothetical protein